MLLSISVAERLKLHIRDVTEAFVMSKTVLHNSVYMHAPKEMGLAKGRAFKVVRPVYGMPVSPMHWFIAYMDYHKQILTTNPPSWTQALYTIKEKIKLMVS